MSLIHWWPLNGDTQDKIGNNNLRYVNNSGKIVTNTSGKLGGCYERTATGSSDLLRSTSKMKIFSEMSICAWVYLSEHANLSTANGIITSHDHTTNSGLGIGMYTTDGNNCYVSINAGNGSSRIHSSYWGTTNIKDGWHHICLAYGSDKKIHMYVDGKEDRAAVSYTIYFKQDYLDIFNWSTGYYSDSNYRPICKVCDARVYDHALSQAEVKELSKALVVHYTFDDILAESTTNVSTINGWSPYTPYFVISERTETGLKLYRPSSSTSDVLALNNSAVTNKMTAGDIWTFSCYLYVDGRPYKCTQSDMSTYNYSGISYYSNDDGYYTCTFKVGAPDAWVIHASMFGAVGTNVICEIDKIQFEKKDHATPYTPTSRVSMMQNETGYAAPKAVTAFQLSTVTNSGKYSGYFDGQTSCIDTPVIKTNMFTEDYTLNFWVYPLDNGRAVYFGDHQLSSIPTINFERKTDGTLRYYHNASPDKSFARTEAPQNTWTMLTVTYTPGTMKVYKNGTLAETFSHTASITKNIDGVMRIGRDKRTGSDSGATPFYGYMSDFRFYVTCLNNNDITELYKTKVYITDKGDIEAHQFIEDKAQAQVTSKYSFEADEFYEELYDGYDVLEYIESTGTQYVDTGYVTTSTDYTYEVDITPTKIGGFYSYMGFMASGTTPRAGIHEYSSVFMLGANATTNSSTKPVVNERVVLKGHFKSGAQKLYKNGTLIASNSTTFNHSANTLSTHIFGRNYSSGRNLTSIKLYSAKIYEGTTLVRHYIPVRRQSDNVLGLYDILTNTFCANSGSGTFKNGPARTNKNASIYEDMHVSGREIIEI